MYAILERKTIQAAELTKVEKEQSSRQLPNNTKNDYIRENESITLSLEDELSNPTLDEDEITMEYDKMSLILKGGLHDPTLVETNELAIEEELSLQEKQVKKEHPELIVEIFHRFFDFWNGRGPTRFNYRKTFLCHKSSMD